MRSKTTPVRLGVSWFSVTFTAVITPSSTVSSTDTVPCMPAAEPEKVPEIPLPAEAWVVSAAVVSAAGASVLCGASVLSAVCPPEHAVRPAAMAAASPQEIILFLIIILLLFLYCLSTLYILTPPPGSVSRENRFLFFFAIYSTILS